jgi:alpha-glucosidase
VAEPSVAATIDLYAALIALRRSQPALNGGGMRWLHVGDDVMVFVREAAESSGLVAAARAGATVVLSGSAVAGAEAATRLFGAAELAASAMGIEITLDGPSFAAWLLPGALLPR